MRSSRTARTRCTALPVLGLSRRFRLRLGERIVLCRRGLAMCLLRIAWGGVRTPWVGRQRAVLLRVGLGRCLRLRHGKRIADGRIGLCRYGRWTCLFRPLLPCFLLARWPLVGLWLTRLALLIRRGRVGGGTLAALLAPHSDGSQQQERASQHRNNAEGHS